MNDKGKSVDDIVINSILIEKMLLEISKLSEDEKWLINELFFIGKSEREVAKETGILRKTISYRKNKIFNKLKKLIKK